MAETQTTEIPRLKARYREEIIPALRSVRVSRKTGKEI